MFLWHCVYNAIIKPAHGADSPSLQPSDGGAISLGSVVLQPPDGGAISLGSVVLAKVTSIIPEPSDCIALWGSS